MRNMSPVLKNIFKRVRFSKVFVFCSFKHSICSVAVGQGERRYCK